MLEGSAQIRTSTPALSMAARVFAWRAAYSARSKAGTVSDINSSPKGSTGKTFSNALVSRAGDREVGDGGILHAGAREVTERDLAFAAPAGGVSGQHRAELGEAGIFCDQARVDGVVQFAQNPRLTQAVGDVDSDPRKGRGVDFVLVLGVRAHRREVLARREPICH